MNTVKSRRKRDSVVNLYNKCQLSGNCPEDVKNKIEHNTLADRLLKWLGSFVYFGGLGIGTSRGTGGMTGYNPLSTPSRVTPQGTIIKPTVVLDPLGPADILPIDAINPSSSSIVPLSEVTPEIELNTLGGVNIGDNDLTTAELEVITDPDPVSDVTSTTSHPTVITGGNEDVAVLDVSPVEPPPKRIALGTKGNSSTPHISVTSSTTDIGRGSDFNVFVDATLGGENIGFAEEIPLDEINSRLKFEIETAPRTSTPREIINRTVGRARNLYNRRFQQVATRNLDFLGQPSRAVTFEFENPAYAPDVSLNFEQDLQEIAAAPDADFADVVRLGRPQFSETDSGTIRLSRAGKRGTIRTRSGIRIGEDVHFYYDISKIDTADAIEMSNLGEHSGDLTIVDALAESSFVDPFQLPDPLQSDEQQLLDQLTENFSNSHLVLTGTRRNTTFAFPTLPPGIGLRIFLDDLPADLFVSYPQTTITPSSGLPINPFTPDVPIEPLPPAIVELDNFDYDLHPSLRLKRKRKRTDLV